MAFVSYAQNFEDVMLWRALKHVHGGFYIDVGAQHPVIDSVSKAFYELGWRGIHIEPVPQYAELLRQDRPDETVLEVALSDTEGTLQLNVIPDTGLSTAVDAYAQRHQLERGFEHTRIQVPVLTLNSALVSLVDQEVHWLKIDVEGLEEKVLKGWDDQTLRPWIMVVEATIPDTPEADYASWDPILTKANYQFVYFDGLNRFYIAKEHPELAGAFSCPPNVFDDVRLGHASSQLCQGLIASHQRRLLDMEAKASAAERAFTALALRAAEVAAIAEQAEAHASRAEAKANDLEALRREHEAREHRAVARARQSEDTITLMLASSSWRVTAPLRALADVIRGESRGATVPPVSAKPAPPTAACLNVLPEPRPVAHRVGVIRAGGTVVDLTSSIELEIARRRAL